MGCAGMILLDTHIWVWWIGGHPDLSQQAEQLIADNQSEGLGVSLISCWEVAKKVELGKLQIDRPITQWLDTALTSPGIRLIDLTLSIMIESTQLPAPFHRDPGDQI